MNMRTGKQSKSHRRHIHTVCNIRMYYGIKNGREIYIIIENHRVESKIKHMYNPANNSFSRKNVFRVRFYHHYQSCSWGEGIDLN